MLRRIALSMVALLAAGPALAGGFATPVATPIVPPPPVVPVTPVIVTNDWSGPYVGAQLGFGRLSSDATFEDELIGDGAEEEFIEGEGALFGVHAGYIFDFGRIVAGAELDYNRAQIGFEDVGSGVETEIGEIDSIARAKLRLGFDAGRVLPYVTAGLARASINYEDEFAADILEDTVSGTFVGLGASFMASERLMVSIEGLRHNFDGPGLTELGEAAFGPAEIDSIVNTLTLRGSFRF